MPEEELLYTQYFVAIVVKTNCMSLTVEGNFDKNWGIEMHTYNPQPPIERLAPDGIRLTHNEFHFQTLVPNGTTHRFVLKRKDNSSVSVRPTGQCEVVYFVGKDERSELAIDVPWEKLEK